MLRKIVNTNKNKSKRRRFHLFLGFVISALLIADIILGAAHIATLTPYAITSDNKVICYVKSHESAKEVMGELFDYLAEEDTDIAAISSDIHIEKAGGKQDTVSVKKAAKAVKKAAKNGEGEVMIVSNATETKSYEPDPVYKKDETMFAGEAEILDEGEDGEKKVEHVTIYYYDTKDVATAAMEKIQKLADEEKSDEKTDWVGATQSGNIIYFGTKAAIKAAK